MCMAMLENELRKKCILDPRTHVEYMDLEIYRGSRCFEKGMFGIRLHQKPENKFLYLPDKSGHERHTISNYVSVGANKTGYIKF